MPEYHREEAVKCFNGTWDLIDNKNRTHADDVNMIHMAHASRYHWGQIGTALEFSRGEWQISRVYSLLRMGRAHCSMPGKPSAYFRKTVLVTSTWPLVTRQWPEPTRFSEITTTKRPTWRRP